MDKECEFCYSRHELQEVEGLTMCTACVIDASSSPMALQEMTDSLRFERFERDSQDPAYIYDLTHPRDRYYDGPDELDDYAVEH